MKKTEVECTYHHDFSHYDINGCPFRRPMVNVKVYAYGDDWLKPRDSHEFSGDAEFWIWLRDLLDSDDGDNWEGKLNTCWQWACESGWQMAAEGIDNLRETNDEAYRRWCNAKVYSAGRQGGWAVVDGLKNVLEWDAIDLALWRKYKRWVESIRDDTLYRAIWDLYVNFWEPIQEEREAEATDEAAALLPVLITT